MSLDQTEPQAANPETEKVTPLVYPARALNWRAPLTWLRLGWQDVRAEPGLSAIFGTVIFVGSVFMSAMAYALGRFALLTALLSGFVYLAPLIGVGLYAVTRARLAGREPQLSESFAMARRVAGHAGVFALIQLVIFMIWSRAGMMITAFVPVEDGNAQSLVEYLLIGSTIGSIFAALTFAVSAFSLPMIADRDTDMVTACLSSINAVLRNKPAALVWALVIVLLTALGFATAMLGLAVIMPWLAYATFHGYRDVFVAPAEDIVPPDKAA